MSDHAACTGVPVTVSELRLFVLDVLRGLSVGHFFFQGCRKKCAMDAFQALRARKPMCTRDAVQSEKGVAPVAPK